MTRIILALSCLLFGCATSEPSATPESESAAITAPAPSEAAIVAAPGEGGVRPDAGAVAADVTWKSFGSPFAVATSQPVASLLNDPAAQVGKVVRIEGTIADTCSKKGCWLILSDGSRQIRVTTLDHAWGVDLDSTGAWADVEGTVVSKAANPEEHEHLKSESARPDLMPEKADAPSYSVVATAIRTRR